MCVCVCWDGCVNVCLGVGVCRDMCQDMSRCVVVYVKLFCRYPRYPEATYAREMNGVCVCVCVCECLCWSVSVCVWVFVCVAICILRSRAGHFRYF